MSKKIISTIDVTMPITQMMTIGGFHPKGNTVLTRIIFWIFCITGAIFTVCSIIKCILEDNLVSFSTSYINFLVASQTFIKTFYFYKNEDKISKILDVMWNDFWPVNTIPTETETNNNHHRLIIRCLKVYRAILSLCIIQISTFPILLSVRQYPYEYYFFGFEDTILHQSPYFELFYIFECITLSVNYALCLIAYDMLFIALGGSVIVQFNMLRSTLLQIGTNDMEENESFAILKKSVIHHNILIKFVNDLEEIVTAPILKQYLDAISCMGIYIYLTQQDFHFLYVFSLMTNLSQTLFFSLFGQLIQDKSFDIANAAYGNQWQHLKSTKVRQGLVLIMQRAQRVNRITAGGFFTLSFETFVRMLKAAGSFLAVLRSTKDN